MLFRSSAVDFFRLNTLYTNLRFRLHTFFTLIGTDVYNFLGATLRDATSQSVRHHNKQLFRVLLTA